MRTLGFGECRVRHLGDDARVEVVAAELTRLHDDATADAVRQALEGLGFTSVDLSRVPLRSGSLNDALQTDQSPINRRTI